MQTKYTIAADVIDHPIHIAVIKGPLTRNLATVLPEVVDEIRDACQEIIRGNSNGESPIFFVRLYKVPKLYDRMGHCSWACHNVADRVPG